MSKPRQAKAFVSVRVGIKDHVIQRLFGAGLTVESVAAGMTTDPRAVARIILGGALAMMVTFGIGQLVGAVGI